MNLLRRVLAGTAIAAMMAMSMADIATAGNKGDGNFCPGRQNSCPSGDTGGDGDGSTTKKKTVNNNNSNNNNNNQGQIIDDCDNRADGTYVINGQVVICSNFDAVHDNEVNIGT